MDSHCDSFNIGPPINDKVVCELSDSDHTQFPDDLKPRVGYVYRATENACSSNPCYHNGICLNGYTDKKYQCECVDGFTGANCENHVCFNNAVGVADPGIVPDEQMTASTMNTFNDSYHPYYGRLNGNRGDGWCAKRCCKRNDWLQVDLGQTTENICGVASQGDIQNAGSVTAFKLSYSADGVSWTTYLDPNAAEMEFHRIGDSIRVNYHELPVPVSTRYIRFHPTNRNIWNCLRVEVYNSTA